MPRPKRAGAKKRRPAKKKKMKTKEEIEEEQKAFLEKKKKEHEEAIKREEEEAERLEREYQKKQLENAMKGGGQARFVRGGGHGKTKHGASMGFGMMMMAGGHGGPSIAQLKEQRRQRQEALKAGRDPNASRATATGPAEERKQEKTTAKKKPAPPPKRAITPSSMRSSKTPATPPKGPAPRKRKKSGPGMVKTPEGYIEEDDYLDSLFLPQISEDGTVVQKGYAPIVLPKPGEHPLIFWKGKIMLRKPGVFGGYEEKYMVIMHSTICIYPNQASPDIFLKVLIRSCALPTLDNTTFTIKSKSFKKGSITFYPTEYRDENSVILLYAMLMNRCCRFFLSSSEGDPRLVHFLDQHPSHGPTSLVLDDHRINQATFRILSRVLTKGSRLNRPIVGLSLSRAGLTDEHLKHLLAIWDAYPDCPIGTLDLSYNKFSHRGIMRVCEYVRFMFELKNLRLRGLHLGETSSGWILKETKATKRKAYRKYWYNTRTKKERPLQDRPDGINMILPYLLEMTDSKAMGIKNKFFCKLRWLDLDDNRICDESFPTLINAWLAHLQKQDSCMTLNGLSVNDNKIGDVGVTVLMNILRNTANHKHFKMGHIRLRNNDIGDMGCESLGQLWAAFKPLLELDISDNKRVTAAGMQQAMKSISGAGIDVSLDFGSGPSNKSTESNTKAASSHVKKPPNPPPPRQKTANAKEPRPAAAPSSSGSETDNKTKSTVPQFKLPAPGSIKGLKKGSRKKKVHPKSKPEVVAEKAEIKKVNIAANGKVAAPPPPRAQSATRAGNIAQNGKVAAPPPPRAKRASLGNIAENGKRAPPPPRRP